MRKLFASFGVNSRPTARQLTARRILSQAVIGCGVALACIYALRMVGIDFSVFDLLIACIVGISLVVAGVKLQGMRRIRRLQ
jgi:peptidoglycan/LPS O-acetylase OafA/YrhL